MTERDKILKRLHTLPEYELVKHIGELNSMNKVHSQNFDSLKQHLGKLPNLKNSTPAGIFSLSIYARIEKTQYDFQLIRLLNNYLSSAFSVIDYTRKHYKKYYSKENFPEYEERVNKCFRENNFHKFMQDFRNYSTHFGIPPLTTTKQAKPKDNNWKTKHFITLDLKHLLESSFNWKSQSKKYLTSHKSDQVEVLNILDEYYSLLNEFQHWYKAKQNKIFEIELSIITEAEREFSSMLFNDLMTHINSGKGYNYNMVENKLLFCFTHDDQTEILSITDTDERLHKMLSKLKDKIDIKFQDIFQLQITLSKDKKNIKPIK